MDISFSVYRSSQMPFRNALFFFFGQWCFVHQIIMLHIKNKQLTTLKILLPSAKINPWKISKKLNLKKVCILSYCTLYESKLFYAHIRTYLETFVCIYVYIYECISIFFWWYITISYLLKTTGVSILQSIHC